MKISKAICLFLIAIIMVGILPACTRNGGASDQSSSGSTSPKDLPVGDGAEATEDDFGSEPDGPTPGEDYDDEDNDDEDNDDEDYDDSEYDDDEEDYDDSEDYDDGDDENTNTSSETKTADNGASILGDRDSLQYYYEGRNYAYGITADNTEMLAFLEPDGTLTDVLYGAGTFNLSTAVRDAKFREFQRTIISKNRGVIVRYDGVCPGGISADIETMYEFAPGGVVITSTIIVSGTTTISSDLNVSKFKREFVKNNQRKGTEMNLNYEWIYPENNDFPYREVESYVTVNRFDEKHHLYTFLRSADIPEKYTNLYTEYPTEDVPLFFGETAVSSAMPFKHVVKFGMAFETVGDERNSRYLALFGSQGSDYAAGIAPVSKAESNSTVFIGDEAELNLNVSNLTDDELIYSVRYELYDYYGKMMDSAIFINSKLPADLRANRRLKVKTDNNYGIFFLNFVVATERYVYREYYPMLILPDKDYKYTSTSPFGINQIQSTGGYAMDFLNLAGKIGVANLRTSALFSRTTEADQKLFEECKRLGIYLIGSNFSNDSIELYGDYIKDIVYGNELNLPTLNDINILDSTFDSYLNKSFKEGLTAKQKYGINHICAGISAGQTKWYEKLSAHWNQFDIIDLHTYGLPASPDLKEAMVGNHAWYVEPSLKRTRDAIQQYGDKKLYVHETGYCSTPGGRQGTDLRTMAEYNTRCFILALAYGVERVMTYSFSDYSNTGIGSAYSDIEFHFGAFYWVDYFGRIMPKPAAASFAGMTRTLESVTKVSINEKYTKDYVRAFTADTAAHGKVVVAWSNCSPLLNDKMVMMQRPYANLPWNNQWTGSEMVEFEATGSKVTVIDTMGNGKVYDVKNGKASVELNGAPVFILGVNP